MASRFPIKRFVGDLIVSDRRLAERSDLKLTIESQGQLEDFPYPTRRRNWNEGNHRGPTLTPASGGCSLRAYAPVGISSHPYHQRKKAAEKVLYESALNVDECELWGTPGDL